MTFLDNFLHARRLERAYLDGYHSADAWLAGDEDAYTSPPDDYGSAERKEWRLGWSDREDEEHAGDDVDPADPSGGCRCSDPGCPCPGLKRGGSP